MKSATARPERSRGGAALLWLAAALAAGPAAAQTFNMSITGPVAAVGPDTVQDYLLTVDNPLTQPLTQVQLVLSLGNGLQLVNPAALGCASATGVQICDVASSVPALTQVPLAFQLRMPATLVTPPQQSFLIAYSGSASNPASATGGNLQAVVSVARSLSFSGSALPTPVAAGGSFLYTIQQTIGGPNPDWSGISIQVAVPPQLQLGAASGAGFSCSGSASTQTCVSTNAALGQSQRSLSIPATAGQVPANTAVPATVTATGTFLTGGNGSIGQTILVTPLDLALSQQLDTPGPLTPGSDARFRVQVRNLTVPGGPAPSGFQVINSLSPGLTLAAAAGADWSCSGSTLVSCTYGVALPPGANTSDLVLTAASTASAVGLLGNNASLAVPADSNPANNQANVVVSYDQPNLQFSQTGPSSARIGETLQYQLVLRNVGTAASPAVLVEDVLPAELDLVGATGEGCAAGNPVRCQLASLPAGAVRTIVVNARARSAGTAVNSATASDGQRTLTASVSTVIAANDPDVSLRKSGAQRAQPGDTLDYVLGVENLGTTPARQVQVLDLLPAGLSLLSADGAGWTCSAAAPVQCSLAGELAPGASAAALNIRTRVSDDVPAGTLVNTATVSAPEDRNPSNDSSSAQTLIEIPIALADLGLSLTAQQPSYSADDELELSFVGQLRNQGPQVATGVRLAGSVDAVAASVVDLQVGAVRCTALASCVVGDLPAGAVQTIQLRLRVDTQSSPSVRVELTASAAESDPVPGDNTVSASSTRVSFGACCDLAGSISGPGMVQVGTDAELVVNVRNFGAQPAVGASLALAATRLRIGAVSGATCTLGDNTTSTTCALPDVPVGTALSVRLTVRGTEAGQGLLRATVNSNSGDPDPANNSAELRIGVDAAPPEVITTVVGQSSDPIVQALAPAVGQVCSSGSASLQAQCQAVAAATGGDAEAVIRSLLPEEILSQGSSVDQLAQVQFDNVNSRMVELRSGEQGFSADGLALGSNGRLLSFGQLRSLFHAAQDSEDEEAPQIGASGELISRWGGFVNGSITRGSQSADDARDGVRDFDAVGVTAGVDYRHSWKWVMGGALGYSRFDSGLADAGTLETRALTLTAYSLWNPNERWYIDTRVSLGQSRMETSRRIRVANIIDTTAFGDTDIGQLSLAAAAGYQIHRGGWNFTPSASVRYLRSEFDAFTETGAGDNNANIAAQSQVSAQVSTAFQVSRAMSMANGVLVPQLDLSVTRELNDDGFQLDAALAGAPTVRIRTTAPAPDQMFGHAGAGLVLVRANGRQFYLSYRRLLGGDGKRSGTLNFGGRFEF